MEKRYYTWLDFLKGIAIIYVVLYHLKVFRNGYLGVDLFLVINGYLVTKSLKKNDFNDKHWYLDFVINRIVRLWPLLIIGIVTTFVIALFNMLPDDLENVAQTVVASSTFTNNILLNITSKNYWNIVQDYKPLLHTWYIGLIVQFYVAYPIIFALAKRINKNRVTDIAYWFTVVLFIVSFVLYAIPMGSVNNKFYFLPYRFFELALGALIAFKEKCEDRRSIKKYFWIALPLLLALFMSKLLFVPINILLVSTVALSGLCVIYATEINEEGYIPSSKLYKCITCIGTASYSIYICHQIIIAFYRYIIDADVGIKGRCICICIIACISVLLYKFIEKPLQNKAKTNSKKIFAISLIFASVMVVCGMFVYMHSGVIKDFPELDLYRNTAKVGMNGVYCDRVYEKDEDFIDDGRIKVLGIGDSYVRDMMNVLMESDMADKLDISYMYSESEDKIDRIKKADYIFLNTNVFSSTSIPPMVDKYMNKEAKLYFVGIKRFGVSNGNIYRKRHKKDYYESTTSYSKVDYIYKLEKEKFKEDEYIDFIKPILREDNTVPVFTDDHKFISQDCKHLTQAGAKYYAGILDIKSLFCN